MIDCGRLNLINADGFAPFAEGLGHIAVDEDRHLGELFGHGNRVRPLQQPPRANRQHLVAVKSSGIKRRINFARERNRDIKPLTQPGDTMRGGININVKRGVQCSQLRQIWEQSLLRIERKYPQTQPHHWIRTGQSLYRIGERIKDRRDEVHQFFAVLIKLNCLMPSFKQRSADKALK